MAYILLFLALAAAGGAAVLWKTASKQEAAAREPSASSEDSAATLEPAAGDSPEQEDDDFFAGFETLPEDDAAEHEHEPEAESPALPAQRHDAVPEPAEELADEAAGEPAGAEPAAAPVPEPEPAAESGTEPDSEPEFEPEVESEPAPEHEAEPEPDLEPEPEVDSEPERDVVSAKAVKAPKQRHLPVIPGMLRREKKAWAEERGYEFAKTDSYLVDEFTRGAASTGAAPKDIVAGNEFGHEMLLMDIGGVNVMAMRTGAASDTVIDFRRTELAADDQSDDLFRAREVDGFTMFAADIPLAERFIDLRVEVALENLPEEVTAVWLESEWVLAQTTKHARSPQWTAMLAPLGLLADAARVLPPRSTANQALRVDEGDPTRLVPKPEPTLPTGPVLVPSLEDEFVHPPVQRPEEPAQLPSRRQGDTRGVMEHSAIGADEVDAIADGRERPHLNPDTPRVPRYFTRGPSIFGDGPEDTPPRDPKEAPTDGPTRD